MKNISRLLWKTFRLRYHLRSNLPSFILENKLPNLYFVKYGYSESRLKSKPTIKKKTEIDNDFQDKKLFYAKKEEIDNIAFPVKGQNVSDLYKKEILSSESSSVQNDKFTNTSSHETIVHKYSPIPSLPSYTQNKIHVNIPTEPDNEEISTIRRFFLGRFAKYLKKFQQSLANEMPDTFHMFNTFTKGFKEFVVDFRDYIGVIIKVSLPFYDIEDLSRRELELHFNMPRQMIRVFPVVAISSLPFAQNLALPIAYIFPKYLLCYHFWDEKQRCEFPLISLKKRLFNARPVFRSMQTRIDEVQDNVLKIKGQLIFFSLGSGIHPSLDQILEVKKLFKDEPYHLDLLYAQHVNGLLRLHGRSALFRRRHRLKEHARYIHCMDKALIKEGLEMLSSEQLRNMLILRGINPSGMSIIEMRDLLDKWIFISKQVNGSCYSLLLHLPIFLAYNHPTNILLINS